MIYIHRRLRPALLFLFFCLTLTTLASAQTIAGSGRDAADEGQIIRALLREVRELRLALLRANVNALRTHTLMERLKNQQSRVDRLTRELGEVRMSLAEATLNRPRMLERLKELEARFNNESDQVLRANLEAEYKEFKFNVDQLADTAEQLKLREAELSRVQNEEAAKLADVNAQLESLLREYETEVLSIKP